MAKPHTFMALCMEHARDSKNFMSYLQREGYTEEEKKKITEAFKNPKGIQGDERF